MASGYKNRFAGNNGSSHDLNTKHNSKSYNRPLTNGHPNEYSHHGEVLPPKETLSPHADHIVSTEMCFFCFDVLYSSLYNLEPPMAPNFSNEAFPLFVTWKIGKHHHLRGCQGTFNALKLHSGIRQFALKSAFKDSRFPPINREEFPQLHCSVSILRSFEEGSDYLDWKLGVHGIRIEFREERGSKYSATYLPEVALERGWNHTQTVDSLVRKAGFRGNVTPELRASITLTRYQSEKVSASYADYANLWQSSGVNQAF